MIVLNAAAAFAFCALQLYVGFALMDQSGTSRQAIKAAVLWASLCAAFAAGVIPDIWVICTQIAVLALGMHYLGRRDLRQALFLSFFYEIAVALWTFLAQVGLGLLFHSSAFLDSENPRHLLAWLPVGVLLAVVLKVRSRKLLAWISAAGLILTVSTGNQTTLPISDDETITWTILAMLLVVANVLYDIEIRRRTESELRAALQEQNEALENQYRMLKDSYAENARLFHDFHNHLDVLRRYLHKGSSDDALRYIEELEGPQAETTVRPLTGDWAADYLIARKSAAARAAGVTLDCDIVFPKNSGVGGSDMTAILGNLLDNGIEAAKSAPEGRERVELRIRSINGMLVIRQDNGYGNPPLMHDGRLRTTKRDNGLHGWGLKSIEAAAERCDGAIDYEYGDGVFRTTVTLMLPEESVQSNP